MGRKAKNVDKPGSDEVLSDRELLERYKKLKSFFEYNWGRIGLELQAIKKPVEITPLLRLVPHIENCAPFCEYAALGCLLKYEDGKGGRTNIGPREIETTRRQFKDADDQASRLSREYYPAKQKADEIATALSAHISQILLQTGSIHSVHAVASGGARKLGLLGLTNRAALLEEHFQQAQKKRHELREQLWFESAWYARNQIVNFVKSESYELTPVAFAKAMAGLPEYAWITSVRRCREIKEVKEETEMRAEYPYQLFQLIVRILRKLKPLNLDKLQTKLLDQLLRKDTDWSLNAYMSSEWFDMQRAFDDCRLKKFNRSVLPYKIIKAFVENAERPKSLAEVELAKLHPLA
jgi:hypothetical protein